MKHNLLLRGLTVAAMLVMASVTTNAKVIIPFGKFVSQPWTAKYTYALISAGTQVPDDWYAADFDDSGWGDVTGPISDGSLSYRNTTWPDNKSTYWLRSHFTLDKVDENLIYNLYVTHDDECTIYLNGVEVYTNASALSSSNYNTVTLSGDALAALKSGENVLCVYVSDSGGGNMFIDFGLYEEDLNDIVTRNDVPFTITNDDSRAWTVSGTTATVKGNGATYNTSWITATYYCDMRSEVSFEWASYNWSSHASALKLFIDGVEQSTTGNSSYTAQRYYLPAGEHVIAFRDTIANNGSVNNWSGVRNMKIKKIAPLETAVLTERSLPLKFEDNSALPWTIEEGYIQSGNFDRSPTASEFITTFTVDETSKFSYEVAIPGWTDVWRENAWRSTHTLYVNVNGIQVEYWEAKRDWTYDEFVLEPGKYTIAFLDTLYANSGYPSRLRNIELISSWQTVELATAGTLGYEVLSLPAYDVLTDVEMLKIIGPMNASDWTDIKNMTNLIALDLSEAVITEIPNQAFDGKTKIQSVILPEGIKTIGEYAFRGTEMRRVNIPSTVTTIKRNAFYGTPIQYLTFAEGSQLQTLECYAFQNCKSLQEVILPEGVTTIGYAAFDQCSAIKRVEMPNTVTSVRAYAFQGCTSMKSIRFSDALTEIREWVCNDCYALTDVHLPVALERINLEAFRDNTSLRHIDFPETLNTIVRVAFYNCALDSVKLPINLQWLGTEAFDYNQNLKYIEFPSYIERGSYSYCYSVRDTDDYRWYDSSSSGYRSNFRNCPNIETIVMRSATPPANDADPFANSRAKSQITLVVPSFSVVNYKLDTYWYQFGSIIEGDDVSYWKLTSPLMLTNNRRMQGTPDVDLYYGGQLTVGGSAPFPMGQFNMFVSEDNPGRLLNTCEAMSAEAATTKFSVAANKWYFFTPLHDVNVADISVSNNASYVFRYYDAQNRAANGASGSWKNVDTDKLLAGQGYIFHCNTACVITFPMDVAGQKQLFRTTDVTSALTVNEAATTANRSWNYVGNPYPCYFDIYYMDFTAPITVWTGSTYKAYSIADDDLVLRPMQSFFVQKPDAVDEIIFHKEGRQLTTSINHAAGVKAQRAPSQTRRSIFDIAIAQGADSNEPTAADETRIVLNPAASLSYELTCDAAKFMSFDASVPQLLTLDEDGNSYAINERPQDEGSVMLAFYAATAGTYTISAQRADGSILLIDNELGTQTDLTAGAYTFTSDATGGVNASRFVLLLGAKDTATGLASELNSEQSAGAVYDLSGRRVGHSTSDIIHSRKGIYIQNGRKVVNK